jgi:iron complex outermembrane recepter protein
LQHLRLAAISENQHFNAQKITQIHAKTTTFRMRNILFSLLLVVGTVGNMLAQTTGTISGTIRQPDGKPAEFATLTLRKAIDSTVVKGALAGDDGSYEITNVSADRYFIQANLVGFAATNSEAFDYKGGNYQATAITMAEASAELQQVTVTARRPTVEVKADKTILNVEGSLSSTGLNALELLRKAPGVTVDNNENVNVRGKNAVRIMIDGRETPLDGASLAALLKGMQAADIANIEIISNPSAKYDASGNAGIINIKLKKNRAFGTNGNVGIEGIYGETLKGGMNLSLNNRSKKVNLFGSYNNHYGRWHNTNTFLREQNGTAFDQESKSYNQNQWNSFRTGADFFINDRHTLGVLVNGNLDDGDWFSRSTTTIRSLAENAPYQQLNAANDVLMQNYNFNSNVNYRFADTSGHTLNVDLDWGTYDIRSFSTQPNVYTSVDGATEITRNDFELNTPTDIEIYTAKADYEQRLWKGTLGLGTKVADVRTENVFDQFLIKNGQSTIDTTRSNTFDYAERTYAGYVNYNRAFGKKLNVQAGLRLETTDYSGDLRTMNNTDTMINLTYTKLFPSAAITYTFTPKIGLNLTYSRRIDRPSYQDLNPFENRLDELTFQRGNERLRPQFTNSFELSPTYQGYPIITLAYSSTKDVFTEVIARDITRPNAAFITKENIADQVNYSASLNFPTPFAKWYEGFVSITVFHSQFSANFDRLGINIENVAFTSGNLYAEQTIKLPHSFSVEVSGWYNLPGYWGTFKNSAQGMMSVSFQKKVFDGNGNIRLRFGDVLGTAGWRGENVFAPGLKMDASGVWEARTVTLGFNYNFGSKEVKAARQRRTGLEDEKNRVKAGRG